MTDLQCPADLADIYRGYTILVVATPQMIHDMIGSRASDSSAPIVLAFDDSGWTLIEPPATGSRP